MRVTRRQFLKILGAVGAQAAIIGVVGGYGRGEMQESCLPDSRGFSTGFSQGFG